MKVEEKMSEQTAMCPRHGVAHGVCVDPVKTDLPEDLLATAWAIIANAGWDTQTPEWKGAAERWRDRYFARDRVHVDDTADVTGRER
ncbi:hypothetical protein LCGC14_2867400 [marine sediment metagenome]|uniref:Uncharacterized protein n=1 Tax=marine sediment metagenome TaxID=412755 RepID=A0A0F8Y3S7_9ZZZZ